MSLMDELDGDPLRQLRAWMAEAQAAGHPEPAAMTLATANRDGQPSARIVLCKEVTSEGVVFYTNYTSRKAEELTARPWAAAVFFWQPPGRQVRVEGPVTRVDRTVSEAYFATRPRESQIGAWASEQSRPAGSFAELQRRVAEAEARFRGQAVPCPPYWGGFLLRPESCEFWSSAPGRLHDRVRCERAGTGWRRVQLFP